MIKLKYDRRPYDGSRHSAYFTIRTVSKRPEDLATLKHVLQPKIEAEARKRLGAADEGGELFSAEYWDHDHGIIFAVRADAEQRPSRSCIQFLEWVVRSHWTPLQG